MYSFIRDRSSLNCNEKQKQLPLLIRKQSFLTRDTNQELILSLIMISMPRLGYQYNSNTSNAIDADKVKYELYR